MKGVAFVRALRALSVSKGSWMNAHDITCDNDPAVATYLAKAAVAATGTDAALAAVSDPVAREFGEYLFAKSLPGKMLAAAVNFPFETPLSGLIGSGSAWVAEGKAIPATRFANNEGMLAPKKVGGLVVVTNDLFRFSATGTDVAIRNSLVSDSVRVIDKMFLSDAESVEGLSPVGILNGAESVSGGVSAMVGKHVDNGNDAETSFLVLPYGAEWLSQAELTVLDKMGITLVFNQYATKATLIDASKLMINVQGAMIEPSKSANIELNDAPTADSLEPTSTETINLFQTNAQAFKAVTVCDWLTIGNAVTTAASA